jgi:hypothetical protein
MLVDFSEILTRLEQALGRHYRLSPSLLNLPGISVALKLDPFYYLTLRPIFGELLGKMGRRDAGKGRRDPGAHGQSGGRPGRTRYPEPLAVFEEGTRSVLRLTADFVPAPWLDRVLIRYGGAVAPLPVSGLRLVVDQRPALEAFLAGMTPLAALAFGEPAPGRPDDAFP